jgi:hypothetical protein
MTKILGSNSSFTTNIQKIVETEKGYFINGQYYYKDTFSPKPLTFLQTIGSTKEIRMHKNLNIKSNGTNNLKNEDSSFIVDKDNQDIKYIVSTNAKSGNTIYFYKIIENDNTVQLLNNYSLSITSNVTFNSFIDQDELYVYFTCQSGASCYLYRLHKINFVAERLFYSDVAGNSNLNIIKITDAFIYYSYQAANGTMNAYRYNKQAKLNEKITITGETASTNSASITSCRSIQDPNNSNVFYFFTICYETATPFTPRIFKYTFDISEVDLTKIYKGKTLMAQNNSSLFELLALPSSTASQIECVYITNNDSKYLIVALYDNYTATPADQTKHGFYLFKINDDDTLDKLQFLSFSSSFIRGFLTANGNKTFIVANDTTVYFVMFDSENERLIISNQAESPPLFIGLDKNENIWIVNQLEEVEMFSLSSPTNVSIKFEKDNYKYEGSDISSYIEIDATNFQGGRVAITLELSIKGDAVFEANNSKLIRELTDVNGIKRIPIIVKGPGSITIYPKLVV